MLKLMLEGWLETEFVNWLTATVPAGQRMLIGGEQKPCLSMHCAAPAERAFSVEVKFRHCDF